jgi:hypothetical protein
MVEFDYKGAEIISECRDCCSIGIRLDGIKDGVGPIVALLLEVRSAFVLGEFIRGVRFSRLGISLCHHGDRRGKRVTDRTHQAGQLLGDPRVTRKRVRRFVA